MLQRAGEAPEIRHLTSGPQVEAVGEHDRRHGFPVRCQRRAIPNIEAPLADHHGGCVANPAQPDDDLVQQLVAAEAGVEVAVLVLDAQEQWRAVGPLEKSTRPPLRSITASMKAW